MKRLIVLLLVLAAACSPRSSREPAAPVTPPSTQHSATATESTVTVPPTTSLVPSTTLPASPSTSSSTPPTSTTTTTIATTTNPPTTAVAAPGTYTGATLTIHLTFRSEVADLTSQEFGAVALEILNDPRGWQRSGFTFVLDEASDLTVVLAEPDRVDALCLPLTTKGFASCQNGAVVALNAERWRSATTTWDSTVADYRRYLVNHEVGHLIGLRHPAQRCPAGEPTSAVMEPQTGGLAGCTGNGWPLAWEHDWAATRPAVVGPLPEWDGPRPEWP